MKALKHPVARVIVLFYRSGKLTQTDSGIHRRPPVAGDDLQRHEDYRQRGIQRILAKPIWLAVQENEHALAYWLAQA
jgi:hypothetical protein